MKTFDSNNVIVPRILAAAFALDAFVSDRIMKIIAADVFQQIDRMPDPIVDVTYHENAGLIANLPVPLPVIVLVMIAATVFVAKKLIDAVSGNDRPKIVALALILGGAAGNLFDRIIFGHVIDWLLLGGRSIVNLADLSIAGGALLYLFAPRPKQFDTVPDPS